MPAGLTDAELNNLGTVLAGRITHLQLHSADPGAAGTTGVTSAGRQAVTWSVDADGDLTITGTLNFTGGAANGACTWVSGWSASTGGTFRGAWQLTGDTTFNSAGEYSLTGLTINGTSS